MLQFGTHFCMQKFFEFAGSHRLRQISWHDFFCAKAGADANARPSAATTTVIFSMCLPPNKTTAESIAPARRELSSGPGHALFLTAF